MLAVETILTVLLTLNEYVKVICFVHYKPSYKVTLQCFLWLSVAFGKGSTAVQFNDN